MLSLMATSTQLAGNPGIDHPVSVLLQSPPARPELRAPETTANSTRDSERLTIDVRVPGGEREVCP
jgi:hypothetical protein